MKKRSNHWILNRKIRKVKNKKRRKIEWLKEEECRFFLCCLFCGFISWLQLLLWGLPVLAWHEVAIISSLVLDLQSKCECCLIGQLLDASVLGLLTVNEFHQDALVLENEWMMMIGGGKGKGKELPDLLGLHKKYI